MLTRILFFTAILFSAVAHAQHADTVVFATYRYADNNRIKNIEPFAEHFGGVVNLPVKVNSYNSVQELIDAMKEGQIDIAFINTFGYLLLRERSKHYSIAAALRIPTGVRSTYQTAIVSSTNSRLTSLDDLRKQRGKFSLLLVNPGSTSGNLIPRLKLATVGITEPEQFFKQVTYSKNHGLTLKEVADGKADLGAFGSEEYHKALAIDPTIASKVNLLWESDPIQLGPVLFKKDLPTKLTDRLITELLVLHDSNKPAFDAIKSGWTEAIPADKFQVVDNLYYDQVLQGNIEAGMRIIKAFAQ